MVTRSRACASLLDVRLIVHGVGVVGDPRGADCDFDLRLGLHCISEPSVTLGRDFSI